MLPSLYRDALTGLDNLFSLIACDLDMIGGRFGSVLYMDLKGLGRINAAYGNHTGDVYIENLSQLIRIKIVEKPINIDCVHAYRTAGDEFTVLFKEVQEIDLQLLASEINVELSSRMETLGIPNTGIHFAVWSYHEPIPSVSFLMKQCNIRLFSTLNNNAANIPRWADLMIDRMYVNVK